MTAQAAMQIVRAAALTIKRILHDLMAQLSTPALIDMPHALLLTKAKASILRRRPRLANSAQEQSAVVRAAFADPAEELAPPRQMLGALEPVLRDELARGTMPTQRPPAGALPLGSYRAHLALPRSGLVQYLICDVPEAT